MKENDKREFEKLLIMLSEVYNEKLTDSKIIVYFEFLKEMNLEDFKQAAFEAGKKCRFFPKPAELITFCEKERERRLEMEPVPSWVALPLNTEELIREAAMGSSELGKAFAKNALALLRGEIDKKTWRDKQTELIQRLPKKDMNECAAMLLKDRTLGDTRSEQDVDDLLAWHENNKRLYRELKYLCRPESPKPRRVPHDEQFQWRHIYLKKINTVNGWGIACKVCGTRVE